MALKKVLTHHLAGLSTQPRVETVIGSNSRHVDYETSSQSLNVVVLQNAKHLETCADRRHGSGRGRLVLARSASVPFVPAS